MKRGLKWILGLSSLAVFFFALDDSGIGFRKHLQSVKDYADGKSERLHFTPEGWRLKKG